MNRPTASLHPSDEEGHTTHTRDVLRAKRGGGPTYLVRDEADLDGVGLEGAGRHGGVRCKLGAGWVLHLESQQSGATRLS